MIWHIFGVASLFFNFENADKLVSTNSELISINKTHITLNTPNTSSNNLINSKLKQPTNIFFKNRERLSLDKIIADTIHTDNFTKSKKLETNEKIIKVDIITYRIFFNGSIEKHIPKVIAGGQENKYKYEYVNKKKIVIDLGTYKFIKVKAYQGNAAEYVNLIDLETVPKYFKKNNYQYHFNIDSRRSFVNEMTLASFFGAMLEVNYLDISCNGFSHKDGSSAPSRSHINGNNGDFKYLRLDKTLKCGSGTSLNISKSAVALDYQRQNKWNDALYKFGWKGMLGWTYTVKKKTKHLHHITHKTTNHQHHLHVQNYEPEFKEIKQ
ncbi:MAG: hypothetical protein ACI87N_001388 [Flavobacteriales bacterium]|jgi:hypothetical protein